MAQTIIKAENISKSYQIGTIDAGTLKQEFQMLWRKRFLKEQKNVTSNDKTIWALKNVSFEINEGEIFGILGKNGAGKSTLLKILSRVALPSSGSIKGKGKIASLLEVGTGFHPELTGRENVFLNGQILGMSKKEIENIFDEIIDFSGIEEFIDTPVKRYSSGMYVRLAFAIAAHLNPDILIIDEALAVGDTAFQKKCLEKMQEIATMQGKTIIIVSHHLQAIRNLCSRAICLQKGMIIDEGKVDDVIFNYLNKEQVQYLTQSYKKLEDAPGNENIRIRKAEVVPQNRNRNVIDIHTSLLIHFEFWKIFKSDKAFKAGIHIFSFTGEYILDISSDYCHIGEGIIAGETLIPANFLKPGSYYISIDFVADNKEKLYSFDVCLTFDIQDQKNTIWHKEWSALVRAPFPITLNEKNKIASPCVQLNLTA